MQERKKYNFPWDKPESVYHDSGPEEMEEFTIEGVTLRVTPTKYTGFHTGRTRYKVECISCGEVIHEMTTGPASRCSSHLRNGCQPKEDK